MHPNATPIDVYAPGSIARPIDNRRRLEMLAGGFIAGYKVPTTREAYSTDLRFWFEFCDQMQVDPLDCHRSVLELFMRDMESRGRMAATVARRCGTINTFYEWLVDEEVIERNPVRKARRPRVPSESTRQHLNAYELARWLKAAEAEGGYPAALAYLLAMNGLRVSEATDADVDDLGRDGYDWTLRIVGKGNKPAIIALNPPTMQAIDAALRGRTTGPLLLNRAEKRMDREAAGRIVRRLCKTAGITGKHITPHSLRHSAITALLNAGTNPRDVQQFARHSDMKTTFRYDRDKQNLARSGSYGMMTIVGSAR